MPGIFQKYVKVYNRAPVTLAVMFDAQREKIPPGEFELPDITVMFAKNQNPIMGSVDPNDPSVHGGRYLIVTENEDGYGVPLTEEEWEEHVKRPCRLDEKAAFQERYGNDPKARQVILGKGRKSTAASRSEAAMKAPVLAEFSNR